MSSPRGANKTRTNIQSLSNPVAESGEVLAEYQVTARYSTCVCQPMPMPGDEEPLNAVYVFRPKDRGGDQVFNEDLVEFAHVEHLVFESDPSGCANLEVIRSGKGTTEITVHWFTENINMQGYKEQRGTVTLPHGAHQMLPRYADDCVRCACRLLSSGGAT